LSEIAVGHLAQELERISPAEIIVADDFKHSALENFACAKKRLSAWQFDADSAQKTLTTQFNTIDLAGFGAQHLTAALCAAGALLDYVKHTQRAALLHITSLSVEQTSQYIQLDAATRRNLEIDVTLRGEASPTLYSLLNTTQTAMGARLLRFWLHHPLRDSNLIIKRHEAVSELKNNALQANIHAACRPIADIERIATRIALKTARPRDLSGLLTSLQQLPVLQNLLVNCKSSLLETLGANLQAPKEALNILQAIKSEPSSLLRDGVRCKPITVIFYCSSKRRKKRVPVCKT
jgi:DNA mismatch repair protein MutS